MRRVVIGVGMAGVVVGLLFWPGTDLLLAVLPHGRSASGTAYGTAFVLLVAGGLGLVHARTARLAGGAVGVLGLVLVGLAARSAVRTGLPDDGTGVLVAAGTLTGLAVIVGAVAAARADRPAPAAAPVWRPVLAGVLAVVLVVAGAVGFVRIAGALPVSSVTAAPAGPPAAVPARPGTPRWTWRSPAGAHTVLPIATGVVVALRDGSVVALDGRDGSPRWSFGRAGAAVEIQTSPDGRYVLAEHAAGPGDGGSPGRVLTVLDAGTGARLWDTPAFTPTADAVEPVRVLTDRVLVVGTAAPSAPGRFGTGALEGRSLTDGHPMWTATREGCETTSSPLTAPAVAPVLWSCPGTGDVLEGLDESTGQRRWQLDAAVVTGLPGTAQTYLDSTLDGRHLLLSAADQGSGGRAPRLVLDPVTGTVRARFDHVAIARNPGRPVAYAVTFGDFPVRPLRPEVAVGPSGTTALPGGCGPLTELTVAATDTTVVRVCHARSGAPLVQVGDRAPAPVGLDPVNTPFRDTSGSRAEVVDPDGSPAGAFAVAAPGAVVVGVPQQVGTVLVGLGQTTVRPSAGRTPRAARRRRRRSRSPRPGCRRAGGARGSPPRSRRS